MRGSRIFEGLSAVSCSIYVILLYMCPHTTIYVSSYRLWGRMGARVTAAVVKRTQSTISVSSYYYIHALRECGAEFWGNEEEEREGGVCRERAGGRNSYNKEEDGQVSKRFRAGGGAAGG